MSTYRVWCNNGDLLAVGLTEWRAWDLCAALRANCHRVHGCDGCAPGELDYRSGERYPRDPCYSSQEADDGDEFSIGEWGQYESVADYINELNEEVSEA